MFQAVGRVLGLASLAFTVLTGPITHVHSVAHGRGVVHHVHLPEAHSEYPDHHSAGPATYDHDGDHGRAEYANPYIAVTTAGTAPLIVLAPRVATIVPPVTRSHALAIPVEQAQSPPGVSARLLRGPPSVLPSSR